MSDPAYPVALSAASPSLVRECAAQRRVGKFIAGARHEASFERFQELVLEAAVDALTDPLRLLILPHLRNSIGQRIPNLSQASRILIEGFLLELVSRGDLVRLTTLSKDFEPYQTIFPAESTRLIEDAIRRLTERLVAKGVLSVNDVLRTVPAGVTVRPQNAQILLGHLLYCGCATTDVAPGVGVDLIRLPHAVPQS